MSARLSATTNARYATNTIYARFTSTPFPALEQSTAGLSLPMQTGFAFNRCSPLKASDPLHTADLVVHTDQTVLEALQADFTAGGNKSARTSSLAAPRRLLHSFPLQAVTFSSSYACFHLKLTALAWTGMLQHLICLATLTSAILITLAAPAPQDLYREQHYRHGEKHESMSVAQSSTGHGPLTLAVRAVRPEEAPLKVQSLTRGTLLNLPTTSTLMNV